MIENFGFASHKTDQIFTIHEINLFRIKISISQTSPKSEDIIK